MRKLDIAYYPAIAIGIILILHTVGFYQIAVNNKAELMESSSLIILISSVLCFIPEFKTLSKNWIPFVSVYLIGLITEMIGVNTGYFFGTYHYSDSLGVKLLETPLMIGVLWLSLNIGIQAFLKQFDLSKWVVIPLGALILLLFDVILEPVAISYNLWTWAEGTPPLYNYICWILIAMVMQYTLWNFTQKNSLFKYLFFINLLFFTGLYFGI